MPTPTTTAAPFDDVMTSSDDVMWTIERDPVLRSTVTTTFLLDRPPAWDELVRRVEQAAIAVPRLRQRVQALPWRLGRPQWVEADLDLGFHVQRVALPPPGTFRQVLDLAAAAAMRGFDLERPLWELIVVEGLEHGRAAIVLKVHHTVTDGVGGVQLMAELLDLEGVPEHEPEPAHVEPAHSAAEAIATQAVARARATQHALPRLAGAAARASTVPLRSARTLVATARSAGHLLAPATEPFSPLFVGRGISWRFDVFEVPLADLRAAAARSDASINDVFVAAVVQGLRDLHAAGPKGVPAQLRMTMPMNLRHEGDPLGGNRFTPLRFTIPIDGPDGDARVRAISALLRKERNEPAVDLSAGLATVLDALPAPILTRVFGGMLRNIDVCATNVPGIPVRCWLAGAEVVRQHAFAPPTGAATNIALLSHRDVACIGIVADTTAVPDHEALAKALEHGFDAIVHGGADERHAPRRPARARKAAPSEASVTAEGGGR